MTVAALKDFMLEQGPSKNTNLMEWDKIWSINKSILDPVTPRYTTIGKENAAHLTIENGPEAIEGRSVFLHAKKEDLGSKVVFYGRNILLEGDDAKTMVEGEKITLMQWGNCTISKITKDAEGKIHITGKIDEADKDFKKTKKVTWLLNDPNTIMEIEIKEYAHLITKPKIEADDDPAEVFNKNSQSTEIAYAEGCVRQVQKGHYF